MSRIAQKKSPVSYTPNAGHLPRDLYRGLAKLYRLSGSLVHHGDCPPELWDALEVLRRAVRKPKEIPLDQVLATLEHMSRASWPPWQRKEKGWSRLAGQLQRDIRRWRAVCPPPDGRYPSNRL